MCARNTKKIRRASVNFMNLLVSFIWLAGFIMWGLNIVKTPAEISYWIFSILSLILSIYYGILYFKQKNK